MAVQRCRAHAGFTGAGAGFAERPVRRGVPARRGGGSRGLGRGARQAVPGATDCARRGGGCAGGGGVASWAALARGSAVLGQAASAALGHRLRAQPARGAAGAPRRGGRRVLLAGFVNRQPSWRARFGWVRFSPARGIFRRGQSLRARRDCGAERPLVGQNLRGHWCN